MKVNTAQKKDLFQLLIVVLVILLIGFISNHFYARIDLTAEKRYTLSNHTKDFLKKIDKPVMVKVYLEGEQLPVGFKRMNKAIHEMLDEFARINKNIDYIFINPTEGEKIEEKRKLWTDLLRLGITAMETQEVEEEGKTSQTMIFPAVVLVYDEYEIGVKLLKTDPRFAPESEQNINNSIQSLEYEFINGLKKLTSEQVRKVAFLEGHGELNEYEVYDATNALSEYYEVVRGKIGGQLNILDGFAAVIIAKPRYRFSQEDLYVLDQYIMQGGKILWLVDGVTAEMDSIVKNGSTMAIYHEINISEVLFKYGARINSDLIQDYRCARIGTQQPFSWPYFPILISRNTHPVNKYVNVIVSEFASTVDTVGEMPDISKTILLETSQKSKISNITIPTEIKFDKFKEEDFTSKAQAIAVLLEGHFESAFNNRLFGNLSKYKSSHLEKSKKSKMIVVGDGDMIKNEVSVSKDGEPQPLSMNLKRFSMNKFPGNKEFILNAVNYLCNDEGLMKLRSRELKLRLLDKKLIKEEKNIWQLVNTILPLILIVVLGILINYYRRKKFTKRDDL